MATISWTARAPNFLRSRWFWAAIAALITIIIFHNAVTADIVSKYSPTRPLWHTANDHTKPDVGLSRTSNEPADTGDHPSSASDQHSDVTDEQPEPDYDLVEPGDSLADVQNSTLGFQRIFAISLPSRTDQHDALTLAGRLLDINIDLMDGVNGSEMNPKAVPLSKEMREKPFLDTNMGAWRAHINILQKIVRENIQSALIMEGDADWDIRIKDQLVQAAKASRILVQPGVGSDHSIDPTSPEPKSNAAATEFTLKDLQRVQPPTSSPYGDVNNWDVFWLGHCDAKFPDPKLRAPLGRVIISDDRTVPQSRWIDTMFGTKALKTDFPDYTRLVHHSTGGVCTFGYAVTQKAARAILFEAGIRLVDNAMDIMLHDMCGGVNRAKLRCLTVQPSYFHQHISQGIISDIHGHSVADDSKPFTRNIRLSSRMNLQQMIFGWDNYTEQWRDDEPGSFD